MRSFSPGGATDSSPPRNSNAQSATKSSWCSSPFSNLVALSPDCNSLSFHLDFSPGASFSSPHVRLNQDQTQSSPHSSNLIQTGRDNFTSLFSPSIFSPFNKTLKNSKMDKVSSSVFSEFLDSNGADSSSSKFADDENFFKSSDISSYSAAEVNNFNGSFGGAMAGLQSPDLLHLDSNVNISNSRNSMPSDGNGNTRKVVKKSPVKGKKLSKTTTKNSGPPTACYVNGPRKLKSGTVAVEDPQKNSTTSNLSKAHNLFASPASLVRGSNQQPSNISPAGTNSGGGHCNCKKSKCLKLYCECFAALRYCNGCNCLECHNSTSYEKERQEAIIVTKERNSQAFQSKVNDKIGHTAGCNCKKSQCLKKYCECFEGSVFCGDNCKCQNCQNFSGSEKLTEVKKHSTEKREKSQSGLTPTLKMLPSPHVITVNNINLPSISSKSGTSRSSLPVNSTPIQPSLSSNKPNIAIPSRSGHTLPNNGSTNTATTPQAEETLLKKRHRRCPSDNDGSSWHPQKAPRGNSPSISEGSDSTQDLSPGGKHVDADDATDDSSPELSLLHSEISPELSRSMPRIEPRYAFFGQNNHRTTKLTALRCLEFLDNKDLYSMSLVNRLWCQAAMDDALWE